MALTGLTTKKHILSNNKLYLSLLFLTIVFSSISQKNRTYIGVNYYPTIATQFNSVVSKPNILRFASNFDLNAHHQFNKRKLYFEYGFKFMNRGYGYTVDIINLQGEKFGEYKYQQHFNYICIPLTIGLKLDVIYIELGPSIDYNYSSQELIKGKWYDLNQLDNKISISGNLSFGTIIEPKMMRSLLFVIGGYANLTLQKSYLNAGIKLGIKYRIKKKNYRRH